MSIDAFLYFPKQAKRQIRGETMDSDFGGKGAFELTDFSFGAENSLQMGSFSDGAGGGKTDFEPFSVSKRADTATCPLFHTLCVGQHIPEAILELRRSGGSDRKSGSTFLKIHFLTVVVKSIKWAGDDESVKEDIEFESGAMKIEYFRQDKTGKLKKADGDAGEAKWSRMLNDEVYRVA
ncbi:type VI secretion system tube protein Hcp [Cognatiyoonia sp. IB215446]|uniref:type VI secretion system tube protein Hcp n=1 Tax=Cognatiyoonia sp. IB215446 TaxID=3097355 RepID=UPI002A171A9D|nr:type VI secretion system tube protein Hcp [Cognatiyoonia sp. IB215446]MDX8346884.1 type VI secretion system tube protein Hcp [Cognatiyoonia sp. IB215446]